MTDYSTVAILILAVTGLALVIALATHVIGPSRTGALKFGTYESGMTPTGDARKRFNVRFYLVAVLFIVFDVELVFLYPGGQVFASMPAALKAEAAGGNWATQLAEQGYSLGYIFGALMIFFVLLLVGFAYEWRKGIFKWD